MLGGILETDRASIVIPLMGSQALTNIEENELAHHRTYMGKPENKDRF